MTKHEVLVLQLKTCRWVGLDTLLTYLLDPIG